MHWNKRLILRKAFVLAYALLSWVFKRSWKVRFESMMTPSNFRDSFISTGVSLAKVRTYKWQELEFSQCLIIDGLL